MYKNDARHSLPPAWMTFSHSYHKYPNFVGSKINAFLIYSEIILWGNIRYGKQSWNPVVYSHGLGGVEQGSNAYIHGKYSVTSRQSDALYKLLYRPGLDKPWVVIVELGNVVIRLSYSILDLEQKKHTKWMK